MKFINTQSDMPYAALLVRYPDDAVLKEDDFYNEVEKRLAAMKAEYLEGYDRKAFWSNNPYFRFFKKFKKTYPVLLQFESLILKDRPFPRFNAISALPFIVEVSTGVLMGAHCINRVHGDIELYVSEARDEFMGYRHELTHTYPGDLCGRDESGIVMSLIAGADDRTCVTDGDRYVFYPIFGCPSQVSEELEPAMEELKRWVGILCPEAEIESVIF